MSFRFRDKRLSTRFWALVRNTGKCWEWVGGKGTGGYGLVRSDANWRKQVYAHRQAYEALVDKVPSGLQLDHLCRNPSCVNPRHLEPVTPRENILRGNALGAINARKTHCMRGHEFTEENTYLDPRYGRRGCRTCRHAWIRRKRAQLKSGAIANG